MVADTRRDAELLERRERHGQHDRGAVGIGRDLALPAAAALLERNDLQMIGIHFRNEQRNVGLHAMVARVGNHHVAGLRELPLDLGCDRGVHGGKDQARRAIAGLALFHLHAVRRLRGMTPSRRQLVASRYSFPAERSLAPSQVISNQG